MTKLKLVPFFLLAIILLTSCTKDDDNATILTLEEVNTALAKDALSLVYDESNPALISNYYDISMKNQFSDISLDFSDYSDLITQRNQQNTTNTREIFRTIAEGDLVMVQSKVTIGSDSALAILNVFKIADNKIIRQWNVRQAISNPEVSALNGNTQFDGGGNINASVTQTELERNKPTVRDFINIGFSQGNEPAFEALFGDEYIQHNPSFPNGKDVILGFIENGGFPVEIKQIGAQGDLVFILADYSAFSSNIIDIFRLDDNGKAVEHWDVSESKSTNTDFFN